MLSGGQMRRIELCRLLAGSQISLYLMSLGNWFRYSNRTHDSERSVSTF